AIKAGKQPIVVNQQLAQKKEESGFKLGITEKIILGCIAALFCMSFFTTLSPYDTVTQIIVCLNVMAALTILACWGAALFWLAMNRRRVGARASTSDASLPGDKWILLATDLLLGALILFLPSVFASPFCQNVLQRMYRDASGIEPLRILARSLEPAALSVALVAIVFFAMWLYRKSMSTARGYSGSGW